MSAVYEAIGRAMMRFWRIRYRRQIRIAAAIGITSVLLGAYLAASRSVDEG